MQYMLSSRVIAFVIFVFNTFYGEQSFAKEVINDGPYISVSDKRLLIDCIIEGDVKHSIMASFSKKASVNECGYPVTLNKTSFANVDTLSYNTAAPIVAASDFHGQYDLMKALLKKHKVIDQQGNWALGKGHFVVTGDVLDRGDKQTEILWFLYHLEHQANKAGGKVHLLLGNHEVLVLNGDLRYLHPKYHQVAKLLGKPFNHLFKRGTVLGNWLRSKPVLVKINNMLFAHGGFHPELAKRQVTLATINNTFKTALVESEMPKERQGFARFLHKTHGPVWYRGYFKDDGATATEIDLLLAHFNVAHIVVGHTSQKQILTKHQGRVIAIDSSMKRGKYGELLFIENNKKWRATLDGKKIALN